MKSHIIPEFMYSGIYDKDPKRFYEIKSKEDSISSKIEQKGTREYLLCSDCECKISKYEKYADENLYGKNNNAKVLLVKSSKIADGKITIEEFENFNYGSMKIFLDSVLWRLLVSNSFNTPKYPDEILEKLRLSILNEIALEPDEFSCIIQTILNQKDEIVNGFILSPIVKKTRSEILSILIDGIELNFYINSDAPQNTNAPFLQKNGKLKIIGIKLVDMPELVEKIKPIMEHLNERLNNSRC